MSRIILIGYRATGKTTISKELGQRLHCPVFDTDSLIEEKIGKSIARIFSEDGEPFFRDIEAETVASVLRGTSSLVLSTGGGVPLREESRRILKKSGLVFWLTASSETIYHRMYSDETTESRRPALTDSEPFMEIEQVLEKRIPLYQETAHFIIDTENKSIAELVDEIVSLAEKA